VAILSSNWLKIKLFKTSIAVDQFSDSTGERDMPIINFGVWNMEWMNDLFAE